MKTTRKNFRAKFADDAEYLERRTRLCQQIESGAVLLCSATPKTLGRDLHYPFQQDSDFLYFTGFNEPKAALFLRNVGGSPQSILYLRERNPHTELWEGTILGTQRARQRFAVDDIRPIERLETDLVNLLAEITHLHLPPGVDPEIDAFIWQLFCNRRSPSTRFPLHLSDVRVLTAEMRLFKSSQEIDAINQAVDVSTKAFRELIGSVRPGVKEQVLAARLDSLMRHYGGEGPAFPTIVASGKNATCLHHQPGDTIVKAGELLVIDAGARVGGYCSDLTRAFAVGNRWSTAAAEVHDLVYSALAKALKVAKQKSCFSKMYNAAVRELATGLHSLKLLKGGVDEIIENQLYLSFFPHRIGHHIGLDTHDITPRGVDTKKGWCSAEQRPFEIGNVFTVEPGLYFPANNRQIPKAFRGLGCRLEQNVAITAEGPVMLSSALETSRDAVSSLIEEMSNE